MLSSFVLASIITASYAPMVTPPLVGDPTVISTQNSYGRGQPRLSSSPEVRSTTESGVTSRIESAPHLISARNLSAPLRHNRLKVKNYR